MALFEPGRSSLSIFFLLVCFRRMVPPKTTFGCFTLWLFIFSSVVMRCSGQTAQSTLKTPRPISLIAACNPSESSATTCTQGPCIRFPCAMQCGVNSTYEICQQHCDRSICDVINCKASQTCNQTCRMGQCEQTNCNAPNCFQDCNYAICKKMTCSKNAIKCVQSAAAEELTCEARSCDQSCSRGFCNASCSSSVKECTQQVDLGRMNMTCAPEVKTCSQTSTRGDSIMRCDADVCNQNCTGYRCVMICSSNVKECYQPCARGAACRLTCEADKCQQECPEKVGSLGCTFDESGKAKNKTNKFKSSFCVSTSCIILLLGVIFMIV